MEKESIHSNKVEPSGSQLLRYIRGMVSTEEAVEMDDWCKESADNEQTLQQIARIYYASQTQERIAARNPEVAYNKFRKQRQHRAHKLWLHRISVVAACLIGIVVMSTLIANWKLQQLVPVNQLITVQANAGMRTSLNLPDGTMVYLNSGSTLSYPLSYDKAERRVTLLGEAYFKVAPNQEQPFIVTTSNNRMRVKVIGTEFNMQAYNEENAISTTLVTGLVSLEFENRNGETVQQKLLPSEKAIYDCITDNIKIESVNTTFDTAWMDGKLIFKETPLPDVLKKIAHFYNVRFEVEDPIIKTYSFTGTFKDKQLSQILDYLKISSRIDYEIRYANEDDSKEVRNTVVVLRKKK